MRPFPVTLATIGAVIMSSNATAQPSAIPAAAIPAAAIAPADEAAIHAILARQAAAWDAHDMAAFVADMTPDVEWINVVGMDWRGRPTVEAAHAALHRSMFAHSTLVPGPVTLQPLGPDVILAVSRTRLEGVGLTPGGSVYPTAGSIMTLVFVRRDGAWRIVHGHNTNIDAHAAAHDPSRAPR